MVDTPEELTTLPIGWDGYDGKPVTLNNCNTALRISEALKDVIPTKPQFVPAPCGSIQIEYHTLGKLIEIFIAGGE